MQSAKIVLQPSAEGIVTRNEAVPGGNRPTDLIVWVDKGRGETKKIARRD